jgi:transposase
MRLTVTKSKNSASLYVIKSTYVNGIRSSKIVEKLGTIEELKKKLGDQDPIEWANEHIKELNRKEKEESREVVVRLSPSKVIAKDEKRTFNGGYLFLQAIYHQLDLPRVCKKIADKYKFAFDLDSILSRLLYARIIFPTSKLATFHLSAKFLESPNFEIQHIYRALEVIAKEMDFLQASLYQNSLKVSKRNTGVLYYDCTNYFFETEYADGLKQYGASKEHRPNPIVQMGLFMDGNGIPLAFNINSGNTNEQITLKPLEEKILADFGCSRFIVCTDAGLSSLDNRNFNNIGERAFITTQSIKKLKKHLKKWSLDPAGWRLPDRSQTFDLNALDEAAYKEHTFFKQRWIKEDGLEQKLIVTFSLKYRNYQRKIRESQVARAQKLIDSNPGNLAKCKQNDFKRFIRRTHVTGDGEVAEKTLYGIDPEIIAAEEEFDGFYAVCTNLEDDALSIIQINHRRWEIEECFRIMKSEFQARPVYLSRDDRIKAHFTTCFFALVIYRLLEKKLKEKFTCNEIVDTLRDMNFLEVKGEGYTPAYTRSALTDALHEAFGFHTDYEIVKTGSMKKIFKATKSR